MTRGLSFAFPLYRIVGEKPVKLVPTEDGGAKFLGWDFEKGEFTHEAADVDDFFPGVGELGPVVDHVEVRDVTREEFEARVAALRREFEEREALRRALEQS